MSLTAASEDDSREVMVAELQPDAAWKKIQQNTFTRWVNQQLKGAGIEINDLESDFEEGLKLIRLVEVLSGRSLGKHNKRVTFRSQKLENISMALNFLENEEHIKIVNIDSSAIADRNLKLILGLIWTLILHYSIAKQIWDTTTTPEEETHERTPKQKLMGWIKGKLPAGLPLNNFTSDWNDGVLLGALVDACAPGLDISWRDWLPSDALMSTETAMKLASEHLNIAPLITASELINPAVDEKSVMTYLSQFPQARYRRMKGRIVGLQSSFTVGIPQAFKIEMASSSCEPQLLITGPDGTPIECKVEAQAVGEYVAHFLPLAVGEHNVRFEVVDASSSDRPELHEMKFIAVEGARLVYDPRGRIGEKSALRIENVDEGPLEVTVVDAKGSHISLPLRNETTHTYVTEYIPLTKGLHSVNILLKKRHIAGSPFPLNVQSVVKHVVWGRGTVRDGIRVGDEVNVYADADVDCDIPVTMQVKNKDGQLIPVDKEYNRQKMRNTFRYRPRCEEELEVSLKCGEDNIGRSPYKVLVSARTESAVRAFGPGVEEGVAGLPCIFYVDTNGDTDKLGFSIEGPGRTEISCTDNSDGSAVVQYTPQERGVYQVNVISRGEHIKNSPFVLMVEPSNEKLKPSSVIVRGLEPATRLITGESTVFRIDAAGLGVAVAPKVVILDPSYLEVSTNLWEVAPSIFECSFTPENAGRHFVNVSAGGIAIPGSPIMVTAHDAVDLGRVRVYGPGVGSDVHCLQPTHFVIDAKRAGPGEVEVALRDGDGSAVDVDVLDNSDGSFTVKYTAPRPGAYQLNVVFAGVEIPRIEINVKPHVDVSGIRLEGLENGDVLLGHHADFRLILGSSLPLFDRLQMVVEAPDGNAYSMKIIYESHGVYSGVWVAHKLGQYSFLVVFDGENVLKRIVNVLAGQDPTKCLATGDGLFHAITGQPARFRIDTQGAGNGELSLAITGPSESKTHIVDHSNGTCTVEYVPVTPGLYEICIVYGEQKLNIPGSPFKALVDYPRVLSNVTVSDFDRHVRTNVPLKFTIDATRTAQRPVDAVLPSGNQQPIVVEDRPRIFTVTCNITGLAGQKIPLLLYYDGEMLPQCPIELTVVPEMDPKRVKLLDECGDPIESNYLASLPTKFLIDVSDAGKGEKLVAEVKGPDGRLRKSSIRATDQNGIYSLHFISDLVGVYEVRVLFNELPISNSPLRVHFVPTGNAHECRIFGLERAEYWAVGEPVTFGVDVADAGPGAVTVLASREQEVDTSVIMDSTRPEAVVTVTPLTTGPHIVNLLYGGQDIPNGTLVFECVSAAQISGALQEEHLLVRDLEFDEVGLVARFPPDPRKFEIELSEGIGAEKLIAVVEMPSGKHDVAQVEDNHDGTVTVKYHPSLYGHHVLSVQHDGVNIPGSPFSFFVDEAKSGYATVYGPGLTQAVVGEPAAFTVCSKGKPQELSVAVEGVAKATIKCHDNKDGTCAVAWVPPVPGEYQVHVKMAGKPVKDSPFTVLVAGEGLKRAHLSVGSTSEVSLNIAAPELKGLSASIKSPMGIEEPCFIRQIDPTHIGVSFTPREAGDHLITVKRNGVVLPKAPFRIKVDKSQVGDASKVIVSGVGRADAVCQQFNDITVDTRNAGFGGLSVSVEGPSKCELNCAEVKNGLINISYRPTEPGVYILSVKFADLHVKDSPFTINCTGKGIGAVKEEIVKETPQAPLVLPGQDATVFLQLPNTSPMEMTAKILNPKGRSDDIEMRDLGGNFYQIKFKPEMEGPHAISVFHKDQHVYGSPFQFTVGHSDEAGAHRVRAAGMGVQRAETNFKQSFNIYTREAGKGTLAVIVEGPSKAALEFKEHKDGNCHVDYTVAAPGVYVISVLFNEEHIPDSPFRVFVAPATGEARRLELASFPDSGMPGKACTFTVLTHRAAGHLEAKVQTPSNTTETIDIVPIDEGESYALRFIPHETGNYYVDVTLDGAPMRDSPFRMRVGNREENDPTAITVIGEGLRTGQTGQKCEFVINTANAGSGLLQIQMDGPSKVTLDAYELDLGYKVRYMALRPGAYFASIKYSGIHIPGSPYKISIDGKELGGSDEADTSMVKIDAPAKTSKGTVAQAPVYTGDASKVIVKGAGLNKFFPGRPAIFNIETGLTGQNLLFVGVVTTKGPCEEVTVKHTGGGNYLVQYRIQDRVKGFIFVKYGDEQVTGSPFAISY